MSLSDDLPLPRRPLFFPVVIATVLLSIIGMSAGLVLGSRHQTPYQAGNQTPYVPDQPTSSPGECPKQMQETARGAGYQVPLTQVLKVQAPSNGTTVWICVDPDGRLFYQANRGGDDALWIEGQTALFLPKVVKKGNGYLATAADGNTFFVNDQRLEVVKKGKKETLDVEPQ